jgi:hypothetical protein
MCQICQTKIPQVSEVPEVIITQRDFSSGTYRIRKSGIYRLKEDISFNPSPEDETSRKDRPQGGWFAAITVECDDVIIDLNGHIVDAGGYSTGETFALICLNQVCPRVSQLWTTYTENLTMRRRIIVQNGILGKSSYAGIFINGNTDITLRRLKIENFNNVAIVMDKFDNVCFSDSEIRGSINFADTSLRDWILRSLITRVSSQDIGKDPRGLMMASLAGSLISEIQRTSKDNDLFKSFNTQQIGIWITEDLSNGKCHISNVIIHDFVRTLIGERLVQCDNIILPIRWRDYETKPNIIARSLALIMLTGQSVGRCKEFLETIVGMSSKQRKDVVRPCQIIPELMGLKIGSLYDLYLEDLNVNNLKNLSVERTKVRGVHMSNCQQCTIYNTKISNLINNDEIIGFSIENSSSVEIDFLDIRDLKSDGKIIGLNLYRSQHLNLDHGEISNQIGRRVVGVMTSTLTNSRIKNYHITELTSIEEDDAIGFLIENNQTTKFYRCSTSQIESHNLATGFLVQGQDQGTKIVDCKSRANLAPLAVGIYLNGGISTQVNRNLIYSNISKEMSNKGENVEVLSGGYGILETTKTEKTSTIIRDNLSFGNTIRDYLVDNKKEKYEVIDHTRVKPRKEIIIQNRGQNISLKPDKTTVNMKIQRKDNTWNISYL